MNKPTPPEILSARLAAGQNQTDAAAEIGMSMRAWQQWESGDRGMSPQLWSMYLLRTHQHPTEKISKSGCSTLNECIMSTCAERFGAEKEKRMDTEQINQATRAYGRELAAGQSGEAAMRAAFNSVFGMGGPNIKRVTLNGVDLVVSFDGEPEDGWAIMVQHGTDISALLSDDQVAVIDRILPKSPDVLIDSLGYSGSVGVR